MNVLRNKKVIILVGLLIVGIIGYYVSDSIANDNEVPDYDFRATWSCSKYDSASSRTYTFGEDGQVRAELDADPQNYYLLGTYTIEQYELEDSLYSEKRGGKVKSYTLQITFDEFVEDGSFEHYDPVSWYVKVYNDNYMRLNLPGGSYSCAMK